MGLDWFEKYKDPRWITFREDILERDGKRCVCCGEATESLHVHHLGYWYLEYPWDADPEAMETLCETCHEIRTEYDRAMSLEVRRKPTSWVVTEAMRGEWREAKKSMGRTENG